MDYSKGSLASNKLEWINIPKPSTDTTHFRVVESLEIPGYENESKNTYPSEVTSGAAQYPWGCSLLTHCQAHDFVLQGPALDRSTFYHCSTFKTDVSCQSNEEKLALGMCSVVQCLALLPLLFTLVQQVSFCPRRKQKSLISSCK